MMTEVLFIGGPLDHKTKYLKKLPPIYRFKESWRSLSGEKYTLYSFGGLAFYFHVDSSPLSALKLLTHHYAGLEPSRFRRCYLCIGGPLNCSWVAIKDIKDKETFDVEFETTSTYILQDIQVAGEVLWVYIYANISSIDALRWLYEEYKE